MPTIKRYPNRKLYDTEAKRYVTLDNITQMIHNGQDVQVVDYESGEDLTNLTLSQIIFEQEKKGSGFLPRSLLTNLVRASGDTLEQMRRTLLHGQGEPVEEAEEVGANAAVLARVDGLVQDVLQSLNLPTKRELQRLQQQLDELNVRISTLLAEEDPAVGGEGDTAVTDQEGNNSHAGSFRPGGVSD